MAKQTTVNLGMGTRGTPVLVFQLFYAFGLIFLINHVGCALAVPRVHTCAELVNPLGEVHLRGSSVRGGGGVPDAAVRQPAVGDKKCTQGPTRTVRSREGAKDLPAFGLQPPPPSFTSQHHLHSPLSSWPQGRSSPKI